MHLHIKSSSVILLIQKFTIMWKYIHRIMCMVYTLLFFYCVLILTNFTIFFRMTSLALGQSYDCPSASEANLKKLVEIHMNPAKNEQYNQTKESIRKAYAYLMEYTKMSIFHLLFRSSGVLLICNCSHFHVIIYIQSLYVIRWYTIPVPMLALHV